MKKFDVVIIGSGPGGYVAALRAAQLGFSTAIVERYSRLGGTCLNVGCIPSKALLDTSEKYYEAQKEFAHHGIIAPNISLDWEKMMKRVQEDVVQKTCDGISFLMKKNKITTLNGHGRFSTPHQLEILDKDSTQVKETIESKHFIIATGSKPSSLPTIPIDKERIITSTEALKFNELPKHLIVIGGGVIGVELGSVYKRLGSKVSVVEYAPSLIPTMDGDLGKELLKCLKKQGLEFYLQSSVTKVEVTKKGKKKDGVEVFYKNSSGEEKSIAGDYCLVCVGRRPYTENLGLEKIQLQLDERGRIITNEHLQTNIPHIYAIGDVIKGPMLAHKAEEEGVFVAEQLAGQKPHMNYRLIPGVVYTWPEVASVGYTQEELKAEGRNFKSGLFPFKASGRARASNESDGFIKVLADQVTDEILGVHMIGPRCADMIAEAVVAMEYRASAEDIARVCHAHPTFTEAFKEACLSATENRALHI